MGIHYKIIPDARKLKSTYSLSLTTHNYRHHLFNNKEASIIIVKKQGCSACETFDDLLYKHAGVIELNQLGPIYNIDIDSQSFWRELFDDFTRDTIFGSKSIATPYIFLWENGKVKNSHKGTYNIQKLVEKFSD
jgi:hypothetical protein